MAFGLESQKTNKQTKNTQQQQQQQQNKNKTKTKTKTKTKQKTKQKHVTGPTSPISDSKENCFRFGAK